MAHVYIHYPYCLYKCHYCDFNSHAYKASDIPQIQYADALIREMSLRRTAYESSGVGFLNPKESLKTIFFGGGTPSLMLVSDVERVLNALRKIFTFTDDIEITLESNPGTVTAEKFREFKSAGINRISLGVQSLNDKYLKAFGRIHTTDEALQAIHAAQNSDVGRVSADLIFGFPGQTLSEWQSDVESITSLGLKHVSAYALTAEEGTLYTQNVKRALLEETDAELFADMQDYTYKRFAEAGLSAYEISNFAAPGEESRHNLGYWHYRSYLGLGAGAHSHFVTANSNEDFVVRHMNHKAPEHYIRKVQDGSDFFTAEKIDRETAMKEWLMMGLRLRQGVSLKDFEDLFNVRLVKTFPQAIAKNQKLERLSLSEDRLAPTASGFFFNNAVIEDFFDEPK